MRKTAIILLLASLTGLAHAQSYQDAWRFSEYNYEGTARTMAMGNAFTALGGDLGSYTINPAGSAVTRYSQFTITPSLNISVNTARGSVLDGESKPYCFDKSVRNSMTRFSVPNLGVALSFDLHRKRGLKNVTAGIVVNNTHREQENLSARGLNNLTSMMGAVAFESTGYPAADLASQDAYNYSNAPWMSILGYQSGMIAPITGKDSEYIGSSEIAQKRLDASGNPVLDPDGNEIYDVMLGGPLNQTFKKVTTGGRYDYVINLGLNFSDMVYVGANLGVTSFFRHNSERFVEMADNPADFEISFNVDGVDEIAYFEEMRYNYDYDASGSGVYGKFGIIVTPGSGLRFGAAIQTPTSSNVRETWKQDAATFYDSNKFNASAETPLGEYKYKVISPMRFNIGAAYTLSDLGLVSVDYEMCDYSTMKFKTLGLDDADIFDLQNEDIRTFMGTSHMLRAGLEIRPASFMAVRAGYGLTTSPEKYYNGDDLEKVGNLTQNFAAGLGFSTKGSFFADFAFGCTKYSMEYVMPYNHYIFDQDAVLIPSPEIRNSKSLWNVMMTLGFRF